MEGEYGLMKNNTITVSAPGKLMLFGEHAVVYGYPSIVTSVQTRIHVDVTRREDALFSFSAPELHIENYTKPISEVGEGDIPKGVRFVESALSHVIQQFPLPHGITIQTHADFSSDVGFGSSSATVVATICALLILFQKQMSEKELFSLAYSVVKDVQGRSSGFDVASALWGKTIYFSGNGNIIEPIPISTLPLVIGYTGVKADTSTLVAMVAAKKQSYPEKVDRIFQAIEKIVVEARDRMIDCDWQRVGKLMDFNQEYLRDIGVSSEKLETLISAAKAGGALGAKLSGAGGGDCMIALYDSEKTKQHISQAIKEAGGTVIDIAPNAKGVSLDQ
jgi:mevalonate kinase